MTRLLLPVCLSVAVLAGCSVTPAITREHTMMTPAEIAEAGLECRTMTQTGTNFPKTFCATEATWAAYDKKTRGATEELLAEGRKVPNVGRFNRN